LKLAEWYQTHLGPKSPVHIVYVAEDSSYLEKAKQRSIKCQTIAQFVQNYYPQATNLYDLYDSISQLDQNSEPESGTSSSTPGQADPSTGYFEVRRLGVYS